MESILATEHQGKNIYFVLTTGQFHTCSQAFTTLGAAMTWLDAVYENADSMPQRGLMQR